MVNRKRTSSCRLRYVMHVFLAKRLWISYLFAPSSLVSFSFLVSLSFSSRADYTQLIASHQQLLVGSRQTMNHIGRSGHIILFRNLKLLPSSQKNKKSNPIPLLFITVVIHTTGINTFDIPPQFFVTLTESYCPCLISVF